MNIFEKALLQNRSTDLIEIVGTKIWEKVHKDKLWDSISIQEKNFVYIDIFEGTVTKGGFYNFFFTNGHYTKQCIAAYKAIKANKTAQLIEQAYKLINNIALDVDKTDRESIILNSSVKTIKEWERLDLILDQYEEDIETLIVDYIKQNIAHFN